MNPNIQSSKENIMNIGTKIGDCRRRKGATQEDLANYTGVSTAAVSKWETEASLPDITLLPKIAEFLEVSIDALMDFELRTDDIGELRRSDNRYLRTKDYNAGIPVYEKALLRCPNDGDLHLGLGDLLSAEASETQCRDTGLRAVGHLEKARKFGCWMNERDLKQLISFTYGCIGEYEKALSCIEDSMYDIQAADYEQKLALHEQAKNRLYSKLFRTAFEFALLTDRLGKCCEHDGDEETQFRLTQLNAGFREMFTKTEKASYFDYLSALDHMELAKAIFYHSGDYNAIVDTVRKAVGHAVRFDETPSFDIRDIGFMKGYGGSISTSGEDLACRTVLNRLKTEPFAGFADEDWFKDCVNRLTAAMRSKKDAGIWE